MNCPHCGMIHQTTCARIKAIEYYQDGTTKRVELHAPLPMVCPPDFRITLDGQSKTVADACGIA